MSAWRDKPYELLQLRSARLRNMKRAHAEPIQDAATIEGVDRLFRACHRARRTAKRCVAVVGPDLMLLSRILYVSCEDDEQACFISPPITVGTDTAYLLPIPSDAYSTYAIARGDSVSGMREFFRALPRGCLGVVAFATPWSGRSPALYAAGSAGIQVNDVLTLSFQ